MKTENKAVDINRSIGDFHYKVDYAKDAGSGLSEKTIHYISDAKEDPDWVREFRLRGLKTFLEKPLLPCVWRRGQADLGRSARGHQTDVRAAWNSRTGAKISRRRGSAVRQR